MNGTAAMSKRCLEREDIHPKRRGKPSNEAMSLDQGWTDLRTDLRT